MVSVACNTEINEMLDLITGGIVVYLVFAYILSFAFCESGHPKASWFFIATFWLLTGHLLTVFFSIVFLVLVIVIGLVTVLLMR